MTDFPIAAVAFDQPDKERAAFGQQASQYQVLSSFEISRLIRALLHVFTYEYVIYI